MGPIDRIKAWEKSIRLRDDTDLADPAERRRAIFVHRVFDHELLRLFWTNQAHIAPDVWRSNHPTEGRWARWAARGLRTVINLRGGNPSVGFQIESAFCEAHGIKLINLPMRARQAPERETLLALIQAFRDAEKPMLIHCKSGADRTGLASAVYLLAIENAPVQAARRMLAPRFIHFRWTRSGVLDAFLDAYEASGAEAFEPWVRDVYDPAKVQAEFDEGRKR